MTWPGDPVPVDVLVVGGGQSGLATGFYLRRAGLRPGADFVIVDRGDGPGGAWREMWPGLRLFSPSTYSSLPGWRMPSWDDATRGFPPRSHVVDYLTRYEDRYDLAVRHGVTVSSVTHAERGPDTRAAPGGDGSGFVVETSAGAFRALVVVSATGTWSRPFWPTYPGAGQFAGRQLHVAQYRSSEEFRGQRVMVVGGGNSAAQILAEVSESADTVWVTKCAPRFLPDDVDGRDLFVAATQRVQALRDGREHEGGVGGLGDIVMVPSVKSARDRGVLKAQPMFSRLTATGVAWPDGSRADVDVVIWCTGFRPALRHLSPMGLRGPDGRVATVVRHGAAGTAALGAPRLFLVGYGDWTGPASATLIGVGRTARDTSADILARLKGKAS
jgi:cation diffusion facilitator CzcD-associated flavoprotein CzcO